jgi:hypothetical protein
MIMNMEMEGNTRLRLRGKEEQGLLYRKQKLQARVSYKQKIVGESMSLPKSNYLNLNKIKISVFRTFTDSCS